MKPTRVNSLTRFDSSIWSRTYLDSSGCNRKQREPRCRQCRVRHWYTLVNRIYSTKLWMSIVAGHEQERSLIVVHRGFRLLRKYLGDPWSTDDWRSECCNEIDSSETIEWFFLFTHWFEQRVIDAYLCIVDCKRRWRDLHVTRHGLLHGDQIFLIEATSCLPG